MSDLARTRVKNGAAWRIGDEDDVAWISARTGVAITAAIPPVFAEYATLVLPGETGAPRDIAGERAQDRALLALLERHTASQPWWLGYLDTGASDVVFSDAPNVKLYWDWSYVMIQAGPEQAASWRPAEGWSNWKSTELPELMFPEDRSWLVSTLWDDDWTCIGGPRTLIADLVTDSSSRAPRTPGQRRPGRHTSGTRRAITTAFWNQSVATTARCRIHEPWASS